MIIIVTIFFYLSKIFRTIIDGLDQNPIEKNIKYHQKLINGQILIFFLSFIFITKFLNKKNSELIRIITSMIIPISISLFRDIIKHYLFIHFKTIEGFNNEYYKINYIIYTILDILEIFSRLIKILISNGQLIKYYIHFVDVFTKGFLLIKQFYSWFKLQKDIHLQFNNTNQNDLIHEDICIVCRSQMEINNSKKLPCGHCFHIDCLSRWVESKTSCPICQKDLNQQIENNNKEINDPEQKIDELLIKIKEFEQKLLNIKEKLKK